MNAAKPLLLAGAGLVLAAPPLAAAPTPPWPPVVGGLAIGAFILALGWLGGRRLGVSSAYYDACRATVDPSLRGSWRIPFLAGILLGGFLAGRVTGVRADLAVPLFDQAWGFGLPAKAALFTLGGVFLGYGARLAGGCTSGHAMMGCSLLRPHSMKAAALFFLAATITTHLVLRAGGT